MHLNFKLIQQHENNRTWIACRKRMKAAALCFDLPQYEITELRGRVSSSYRVFHALFCYPQPQSRLPRVVPKLLIRGNNITSNHFKNHSLSSVLLSCNKNSMNKSLRGVTIRPSLPVTMIKVKEMVCLFSLMNLAKSGQSPAITGILYKRIYVEANSWQEMEFGDRQISGIG